MTGPDPHSVDRVVGYIDDFFDTIDFHRPGREGSWGDDIAWAIIRGDNAGAQGGIVGRCAQGVRPDGAAWPDNSDDPPGRGYRSRKLRQYGWDETNRRSGDLLSAAKLYGQTEIGRRDVTLKYGTDSPPSASYAPTGRLSDADKEITDIEKATYAHAAGRKFYGLGPGDAEAVSAISQEHLNELIREAGRP